MAGTEPAGVEGGVLEVYEGPDGRWAWCYREPRCELALRSNKDFATAEEAMASACRAYPDLDVRVPEPGSPAN